MMNRIIDRRDTVALSLLLAMGAALRLIALPLSNNPGGDPVSRIFDAWRWWDAPHLITHGVWGPLHTYLLGPIIGLTGNTTTAPVILNILLSVVTAIPVYLFTKREIEARFAWLGAAFFGLYPVAFRNSLMSMSETPFVFCIAAALLLLSYARAREGRLWQAALAGLFVTWACMLRYEGWVLLPFLGLVLLHKPRAMAIFGTVGIIHPLLWMIGNHHFYGDFLYSVSVARDWQIKTEGINSNINRSLMVCRSLFYPLILFSGITPIVFALTCLGVARTARHRLSSLVWLIPFTALLSVATLKVINGSMYRRPSYSIVLGLLLIPYAAAGAAALVQRLRTPRLALAALAITLASPLPLSYLDYQTLPVIGRSWNRIVPRRRTIHAIPRSSRQYKAVCQAMQDSNAVPPNGGLICDFVTWHETSHMALHSRLHPDRVLLAPGGRNQQPKVSVTRKFLEKYPRGALVLNPDSRYATLFTQLSPGTLRLDTTTVEIDVETLGNVGNLTIYRYAAHPRPADAVSAERQPLPIDATAQD